MCMHFFSTADEEASQYIQDISKSLSSSNGNFLYYLVSTMVFENFFCLDSHKKLKMLQECPFGTFKTSRLSATAFASTSRTDSVSSQPIHASVILTPYFRPDLPSFGTFWLPEKNQ
jgi:hypothetical protein